MSERIKAKAMIAMARLVRGLFVLGLCLSGAALSAQRDASDAAVVTPTMTTTTTVTAE